MEDKPDLGRWVLGITATIFIGYGLICFLYPGFVASIVSLEPTGESALIELRAMYGGLQMAIGLLALSGALMAELRRPTLLMILFLLGGLALARTLAVMISGIWDFYNLFALVYEISTALAALVAVTRPTSGDDATRA